MSYRNLRKASARNSEMMFPIHNCIQATGVTKGRDEQKQEDAQSSTINCKLEESLVRQKAIENQEDSVMKKINCILDKNKISDHGNMVKYRKRLKDIRISFDDDVVETRSPYTLPYSQCDVDDIYHNTDHIKSKANRSYISAKFNRSKSRIQKCPVKTNEVNVSTGLSNFLFGVDYNAETVLKSKQLISLTPPPSPVQRSSMKTYQKTWEELVFSQLSKDSADMILNLKELTPPTQVERLKNILNQSVDSKKVRNDPSLHHVKFVQDIDVIELSGENVTNDKVESSISYFDNVPGCLEMEKHTQGIYPNDPSKWNEIVKYDEAKVGRLLRGIKKWTAHPTTCEVEDLTLRQLSDTCLYDKSLSIYGMVKKKSTSKLIPLIIEWRSKWMLEKEWERKSLPSLREGMRNINDHTRLEAVSAIGAGIFIPREIDSEDEETEERKYEDQILEDINALLYDPSPYVSLAAAVTLFSINRSIDKAVEVLMNTVKEGLPDERWLAVQCLAEYGHHDDCIVRELIRCIFNEESFKQEKAKHMLKKLSAWSNSIIYLVAEKLNSTCWKYRTVACQILSFLNEEVSDDIANKLCHLSWNDWSPDVRQSATIALGKTGNAKLMHMVLRRLLDSGESRKQISALKTMTVIGIMTAHFFNPLLDCLLSKNNAVVLHVIKCCKKLKLTDDILLKALCSLINSDRPYKVKRRTIRALGYIGCKTGFVRDILLDTLHFHPEARLRKEACSAITKLGFQDDEIVNVLQDLVFIDDDFDVRCEAGKALDSMGLQIVGDVNLTETIQKCVKELGKKENIIAYILGEDENELRESMVRCASSAGKLSQPGKNTEGSRTTVDHVGKERESSSSMIVGDNSENTN